MSNTRSANIIDRVGRNRWGRISQECRFLMNETWEQDKDFRIYDIKKSKKFKKPVLQFLIQKSISQNIVITYALHVTLWLKNY